MLGKASRSAKMSTPLVLLLCAGCTTVSVVAPEPLKCDQFLPTELTTDTPHAPPPSNDSAKEWVGFGIAEAGQLNKSNVDRRVERAICRKVEEANIRMHAKAKDKVAKRWWQFWR